MPRYSLSPVLVAAALTAVIGSSAHAAGGSWHNGSWYADGDNLPASPAHDQVPSSSISPPSGGTSQYPQSSHDAQPMTMPGRDAWLADCRTRVQARDNGVGGALIGGVVGGVAGNRIAGRHNRTVGTLGGAAVGAVAGAVIDRAEDRGRRSDECEAYLDDYYARYAASYTNQTSWDSYHGSSGYPMISDRGYAYPNNSGCCGGVPVMMVPVQVQPECTETIEYIYEDVPVRQHSYRPRHKKVVPDKRVKIVPDKRTRVE